MADLLGQAQEGLVNNTPPSNDAANPMAKMNRSITPVHLKFPLEDEATYHTHHVTFQVFELRRKDRTAGDKKIPKATITLPMTQELQVQYNATYSGEDLGAVGKTVIDTASSAAGAVGDAFKDLPGFIRKITEKAKEATAGGVDGAVAAGVGTVAAAGASTVLSAGGALAQAGVSMVFGTARNPHKALFFTGTEFRNHTFQFRFIPVRQKESDVIRKIIHIFKYHMHPGFLTILGGGGNHFFTNPEFFEIQLSNHGAYTVSDYRTCVLKNITVNYHPSNYPAYARSEGSLPAPMEVVMNLEFQEIDIITKDVVTDPYYVPAEVTVETSGVDAGYT